MTTSSFDPDHGASNRPIDALRRVLHSRESNTQRRFWHPRRDQVWVDRHQDTYFLSIRRGKERYLLSESAIKQLAGICDMSVALLTRLRTLPGENEDTVLLNRLLWHAGADDDYRLQAIVKGKYLNKVFTGEYTPVLMLSLATMLERAEGEGRLRLVSFDVKGSATRLMLSHQGVSPYSFSGRSGERWLPGAVLVNQEDGGSAAITAPALISEFGHRALIVPSDSEAIRRRRHKDVSSRTLTQLLLSDIDTTRNAPYDTMVRRIKGLQGVRVANSEMSSVLGSARIRGLTSTARNQIALKAGGQGRSLYWLVLQIMSAARDLPLDRRLQLELDLGRFVWTRGQDVSRTTSPAKSTGHT